ncbi:MAG: zinc-ribbon domain containing protein [Chloroflexota bacterium]
MEKTQKENDQIIRCVDCGTGFILTPGERQFYLDRKLNLPKRCPACRRRRRQGASHG